MKTLYLKTYGCQMNEHDSARIADILKKSHGLKFTPSPENADVILFNTCSVRAKAEEKVFSDLGRIKHLKVKNPNLIIGVGGCVATQEAKNIFRRAPYVSLVFGPQSLHRLPELLEKAKKKKTIDIDFTPVEKFDNLPAPEKKGPSAYISIMEGCNNFCSYCIVPYVRGRETSRSFKSILNEAKNLSEQGVKEIHLLGQNVNHYRGKRENGESVDLVDLLYVIHELPRVERIRFTTSHPGYFFDRMLEAYHNLPKLVNHLHLPVQSGSNRILKLMHRAYTREKYLEVINKMKAVCSNISLSSDFIVGFPSETEKDFEQTLALIDEIKFDHSFSFMYSPRPGTQAAKLKDDVPLKTKKARLYALQEKLIVHEKTISQNMLNTFQKVLVMGPDKKASGQLSGRTENNRIVHFEGDKQLIGKLVNVIITDVLKNSLRGNLEK